MCISVNYHSNKFHQGPNMSLQSVPALVRSEFSRVFREEPRMYRAPARINIIGEHLDYNGGCVLPSAVDLFTWVAVSPRNDAILDIHLCHDGSRQQIVLGDLSKDGSGSVAEYLKGVAWALRSAGVEPRGCNLVIGGSIPLGGGLSSSASLELAVARALADRAGVQLEREQMALLCHKAEVDFVGVQCGIMDQYAIALGAGGHAMVLDCRSRQFELLPLPENAKFLVVHSGVSRRLPAGGYNARRDECTSAVELLRQSNPGLRYLAELDSGQISENRNRLGETLFRRCRHVVSEHQRVREATGAMREANLELLGSLINESHESLRDDYEVSCSELDALVEIARKCDGVLGSRMMGGGFGGCTISLVRPGDVTETVRRISQEYSKVIGRPPWMHVAGPAGPVAELEEGHEP
jgi:galactokinase